MFAVVFYHVDKSLDIVHKNKVKSVKDNEKPDIGNCVKVQYKTQVIDESGKNITSLEDFEGLVLAVDMGK